jgi:hypothetical protein
MSQGWDIKDEYRNTSRDDMPDRETITTFGDRLISLAERVIAEQGGKRIIRDGTTFYQISIEQPANIEPLPDQAELTARLRETMGGEIEEGVVRGVTDQEKARAAYEAICLDLAQTLREKYPGPWAKALEALNRYPKVVGVLFFEADNTTGDALRERALTVGLKKPEKRVKIW